MMPRDGWTLFPNLSLAKYSFFTSNPVCGRQHHRSLALWHLFWWSPFRNIELYLTDLVLSVLILHRFSIKLIVSWFPQTRLQGCCYVAFLWHAAPACRRQDALSEGIFVPNCDTSHPIISLWEKRLLAMSRCTMMQDPTYKIHACKWKAFYT